MRVMSSQSMKGLTRGQIEANRAAAMARMQAMGMRWIRLWRASRKRTAPILSGEFASDYGGGCDAVLFLDGWEDARGSRMEHVACERYRVQIIEYLLSTS